MECKNCKKSFKACEWIDGKLRNLSNRRYCFECSPFGKHNTRQIHAAGHKKINKCIQCNKDYVGGHGKYKNICNSCKVSNYRIALKKELIALLGGKCIICGYDKCIGALEFHHVDPKAKELTISGSTKNKKFLFNEIKKCILVCCRCHREIHSGIAQG